MGLREAPTDDILDSIGEGLFTVDVNFKINYFNRAAETITGYKREEVLGRLCKHIFQSNQCFDKCPIGRVLESGKNIYDMESTIRNKNGTVTPIKLNSSILKNEDDEPVGGVVSFRDISDLEILRNKFTDDNQFYGVIGHSKAMHEIFELIEEIADSDATVLIQGDSGTGKEMVANAIQMRSQRKKMPYIKVNCSVFTPQLLASELFGHVKGAFTGAIKDRAGRFEVADKGTLFLDEVAEMPTQMQLQLLRVLQEGTFERVGESKTRKVDVRVIAATNKNLKEEIEHKRFREDLYYRLNVIPIEIPPLKDRPEDIPHLIQYFIKKFALLYKKNIQDIDDQALDLLLNYSWPGNIRELENIIEYGFARTRDNNNVIQLDKLPPSIRKSSVNYRVSDRMLEKSDLTGSVSEQKVAIRQMLEKHRWNKTRVAKELGIGRSTLWRKIKQLDIEE
ncbi:PAS domain S-box protein [candidate division KSB1 bacterium]|nr:PAS domain S-box protein [candidate division KSB1 bacterium]